MKNLKNEELTNHMVFNLYDEVIEPTIADESELEGVLFYSELFDAEELTDDYGNEYLIFIKVVLDEHHTDDDLDAWFEYLAKDYRHIDLVLKLNESLEELGYNSGDYVHTFGEPIRMNTSITIPLLIQK